MTRIAEKNDAQKQPTPGWIGFFERGWFAPLLLSIQPVLHLFALNVAELEVSEILRSLLIALLLGGITLGAALLLVRRRQKASLVASLFIFLFFLFGDMAAWISQTFKVGPARADLLTLVFVIVVMAVWIGRVRNRVRNIASLNLYFNLLAILLLIQSAVLMSRTLSTNGFSLRFSPSTPRTVATTNERHPDIYYIILDGYGRQDVLQALYQFDNSSFLNGLKAKGFYVAAQASSNYIQTMLSLSSSLNMDYLQTLQTEGIPIENRADLVELVENNDVREVLAQNGYQVISFPNEYKATISSAELYYDDEQAAGTLRPVTSFESILFDHTMLRVLLHVPFFNRAFIEVPYDTHRRHILSSFAKLQQVPAMDGNYLIYAHIIAPHPPFVFEEDGTIVSHEEPFTLHDANYYIRDHSQKSYIAGYRRQIQYINTRILEAVDAILARSDTPPIIILQSDHGPGAYLHWGSLEQTVPAERFGILNAYYFPDQNYVSLYPSISPVNSFRVVLNQYFDAGYDLLPDRHYYSSWSFPFDFIEVTDISLP